MVCGWRSHSYVPACWERCLFVAWSTEILLLTWLPIPLQASSGYSGSVDLKKIFQAFDSDGARLFAGREW